MKDKHVITINGDLTFATVLSVCKQYSHYFEKNHVDIEVDLRTVKHSDSAGLALLVAWLRRAKHTNKILRFINPSQQIMAMARVCGLANILPFVQTKKRLRK